MRQRDLRAADSDREQVCERLRAAATEGRIDHDELDERMTAALRARTYGELDATIADLPRLDRRVVAGRRSGSARVAATVGGRTLSTLRANPWLLLFAVPVVMTVGALLLAATVLWTLVTLVVMLTPCGPRHPRGPWTYQAHRGWATPPPRRFWA